MDQIAFAAAAFALLTAAILTSASAAEPYARRYPVQSGTVTAGAPCPGFSRSGTQAHYVWKQGYTRKGKWQYRWTCEE